MKTTKETPKEARERLALWSLMDKNLNQRYKLRQIITPCLVKRPKTSILSNLLNK
jgi:hypothetical protein